MNRFPITTVFNAKENNNIKNYIRNTFNGHLFQEHHRQNRLKSLTFFILPIYLWNDAWFIFLGDIKTWKIYSECLSRKYYFNWQMSIRKRLKFLAPIKRFEENVKNEWHREIERERREEMERRTFSAERGKEKKKGSKK